VSGSGICWAICKLEQPWVRKWLLKCYVYASETKYSDDKLFFFVSLQRRLFHCTKMYSEMQWFRIRRQDNQHKEIVSKRLVCGCYYWCWLMLLSSYLCIEWLTCDYVHNLHCSSAVKYNGTHTERSCDIVTCSVVVILGRYGSFHLWMNVWQQVNARLGVTWTWLTSEAPVSQPGVRLKLIWFDLLWIRCRIHDKSNQWSLSLKHIAECSICGPVNKCFPFIKWWQWHACN